VDYGVDKPVVIVTGLTSGIGRCEGHREDIAAACEYLLNTTYTSSECIAVDGGMRLVV
jgi:hypothetical protein